MRRVTGACLFLALAGLAIPVLVAPVPPLIDFPNHLARLWLLAGGAAVAPLDTMYAPSWTASTNVATDLLATLANTQTVTAYARFLVLAAALLPPLGAVLLNRRLFGGLSWVQVAFPALAWSTTMLIGLLNFQIGLGLALMAAALDLGLQRFGATPRLLVRAALGCMLILVHVFAAGFYAALLTAMAFGFRPVWRSTAAWANAAAAALASLGVPVLLFLLFGAAIPSGLPAGTYPLWGGDFILNKQLVAVSPFYSYDIRFDLLFFALLWLVLRAGAGAGWFRHRGMTAAGLALATIGLVIPSTVDGTPLIDYRFPIMALFTLAAGWRPAPGPSRFAPVLLLALCLTRDGAIAAIWSARQADVRAVERALTQVPAGARVLPAFRCCAPPGGQPYGRLIRANMGTFGQLPALAVPERHAFIPNLFAIPGRHPLRVLPAYADIAVIEGPPAPVGLLRIDPSRLGFALRYLRQWRRTFDYMLVLNADALDPEAEDTLPELDLLADEGFARLYRINGPAHVTPGR